MMGRRSPNTSEVNRLLIFDSGPISDHISVQQTNQQDERKANIK